MSIKIEQESFGKLPDGRSVDLFILRSDQLVLKLTNFGGRITELHTPDRGGRMGNIVLGFDNLQRYLAPNPYLGATIGRVANRIARGRFTLDGTTHQLATNNGPNCLHGGVRGFDQKLFKSEQTERGVRLNYHSPDGEENFPGNLDLRVELTVQSDSELRIQYVAHSDRATPVNSTNHSYFNLAGAGSGTILDHELTLFADQYTPVDATLIPTGEIAAVRGTPMDFTTAHRIGERIAQVPGGYDHNYVLRESRDELKHAARLRDIASGRMMDTFTTQPGIQFYSGNFLDGSIRGIGGAFVKWGALCLETQHFPDSVNHPRFPNTLLRPGETYRHATIYGFGND